MHNKIRLAFRWAVIALLIHSVRLDGVVKIAALVVDFLHEKSNKWQTAFVRFVSGSPTVYLIKPLAVGRSCVRQLGGVAILSGLRRIVPLAVQGTSAKIASKGSPSYHLSKSAAFATLQAA